MNKINQQAKFLLTLLLLGLFQVNTIVFSQENQLSYTVLSSYIEVGLDGSITSIIKIRIDETPQVIVLPTIGNPIYYTAVSNGVEQPIKSFDNHLNITAFSNNITIIYTSLDVTTKKEELWNLHVYLPWETVIVFPEDSILLTTNTLFDIVLVNNTIGYKFQEGEVNLTYIIIPKYVEEQANNTEENTGVLNQNTSINTIIIIVAIMVVVGGSSFTYLYFRNRRKESFQEEIEMQVDDRDRIILEVIRKKGECTANDIMNETGIPKTPLYRRLRKLVDMGLIDYRDRGGHRYFRIKKE